MNMKNKGFTLIELLITITLITVISVAAGVGINEMFTRQRERNYEQFVKTIENAACTYESIENRLDNEGTTYVSVCKLITDGLLSNTLSNPLNKEKLTKNSKVCVKINRDSNGEKTCNILFYAAGVPGASECNVVLNSCS
jgi:prepilin-type N-terminal cleavage/methylation domain-containing protein